MAKKKMGGLGKGLDSLFADLSDDTGSEASNSTLPLREIEPDPEQPRKRFDEESLQDLADSIRIHGVIQPLTVRRLASLHLRRRRIGKLDQHARTESSEPFDGRQGPAVHPQQDAQRGAAFGAQGRSDWRVHRY